jgi:predicted small secreted protein
MRAYRAAEANCNALQGRQFWGRPATCASRESDNGTIIASADCMRSHPYIVAIVALLVAFAAAGCHNTARGVREDTSNALHRAGDKVEGHRR